MTKLTKEDFIFNWDRLEAASANDNTFDISMREVTKEVFDDVIGAYDHVFYEDEFDGMKRYLSVEKIDGNTRIQVAEYEGRYFHGYWYADEPDYVMDQKSFITPSHVWDHDSDVAYEIAREPEKVTFKQFRDAVNAISTEFDDVQVVVGSSIDEDEFVPGVNFLFVKSQDGSPWVLSIDGLHEGITHTELSYEEFTSHDDPGDRD